MRSLKFFHIVGAYKVLSVSLSDLTVLINKMCETVVLQKACSLGNVSI